MEHIVNLMHAVYKIQTVSSAAYTSQEFGPTHLEVSLRVPVVLKCKIVVARSTSAPASQTYGTCLLS